VFPEGKQWKKTTILFHVPSLEKGVLDSTGKLAARATSYGRLAIAA